jgi:circadian clock protein KaiC
MLYGGFIPNSAILLRGAPGTGKTTFAFQYLIEGVRQGQPGMLVSFEEFPESLYRDAASVGWDLKTLEATGLLHIVFTSPEVFLQSVTAAESPLLRRLHDHNIRRIALDSLTHFTRLAANTSELRDLYNRVVNALRREELTALYIGEEMRSDFTYDERGRLSFIVDCIILLRYLEIDSAIQRALVVLKMRSSDHDKRIHSYTIQAGETDDAPRIQIGSPLQGKAGLLIGLTEKRIISSVRSVPYP